MKDKLISAEKLFAVLRDDININGSNLAKVKRHINAAPAVDAVEVVHGRWVMTLYKTTSKRGRVIANKKFACSVCGYCNGRKQSNYCPHCGAKMDGDGNG